MKGLREFRIFYAFYLLQAGALLAVLIPFVRYNNLLEWDFPGHFAAIWHTRNELLPWPTGWNPYFYAGYPQGPFYPPLAHYAAALLSLAIGIAPAMKTLVVTSLLALPAVFCSFSRRWGLDELQSSVAATWMTALLFVSGQSLGTWTFGADLNSILNVGLFANALSLPVLFAFFATCGRGHSKSSWKVPALLLGILLLLHPLSSLIAAIFLAAFTLSNGLRAIAHPQLRTPLITLGIALLLGGFWIIPFLVFRGYMNPEFTAARWSSTIILLVMNGTILAIFSYSKFLLRPLILTYLILANFIMIGTLWEMSLQFTRLTIYLLFMIPVFLLSWIRSRAILVLLAFLALVVGYQGFSRSGIRPRGVSDFSVRSIGPVEGRILSVAPQSHLPSYHVHHDTIPVQTGNVSLLGLFIESSLNGRFLGNLARGLDPEAYVWGTPTEVVRPEFLGPEYPQYMMDRLKLFDIRYIYTDLRLETILDPSLSQRKTYVNSYRMPHDATESSGNSLASRYHVRDGYFDFYLYSLGPGTIVDPLSYVPAAPGTDWKLTNQKWFMGMRGVPIFTERPAPPNVRAARPGESVEVVSRSPNMDRWMFKVRAEADIPLFVKIGYFPAWRATANGSPIPVYRASPNLIILFAHGDVVLEYRRPWVEYVGLVSTLLGFIALLLL